MLAAYLVAVQVRALQERPKDDHTSVFAVEVCPAELVLYSARW